MKTSWLTILELYTAAYTSFFCPCPVLFKAISASLSYKLAMKSKNVQATCTANLGIGQHIRLHKLRNFHFGRNL
jgi:hypothetical protein